MTEMKDIKVMKHIYKPVLIVIAVLLLVLIISFGMIRIRIVIKDKIIEDKLYQLAKTIDKHCIVSAELSDDNSILLYDEKDTLIEKYPMDSFLQDTILRIDFHPDQIIVVTNAWISGESGFIITYDSSVPNINGIKETRRIQNNLYFYTGNYMFTEKFGLK
ncbi:MAG: hypothetical protein IKR03_02240 [Clostridia bacterium]|nr:hypothetical protein [Christensenellaceae bacterium]MBR6239579.1 hypothetical protein [Clostridia bacterium]